MVVSGMETRIVSTIDGVPFQDGPDRGRILVSGRDTGGRYSLMEWVVAPGVAGAYGAHRHHDIEETFLVRSGTLEFLLDDTVVTLGPGDFVRVPPGVRHGYANTSGAEVDLLVTFHPGGFEELFLKYRTDRDSPPEGEGFIADAVRDFASEFEP